MSTSYCKVSSELLPIETNEYRSIIIPIIGGINKFSPRD